MTRPMTRYSVRLTPEQYQQIAKKARDAGVSVNRLFVDSALASGSDSSLEIAVADLIAGQTNAVVSALGRMSEEQIEREETFKSGLRKTLQQIADAINRGGVK